MLRTLLAALTAVLIVPAAAEAAFPGANGRIAFNWTFGCDGSVIATMKPNGSGKQAVIGGRFGRRHFPNKVDWGTHP